MQRRLLPLIAALCLWAGAAPAAEVRTAPKVVLELFTSQGCPSCPRADALLESLSQRSDVITLAYHVDYWDYVGWPDTFGDKLNSDRQRAYAESWGSARIFTPQLVVNGAKGVVGSRAEEVDTALATTSLDLPVTLRVERGMLKVDIPENAALGEAVIWLVTFLDRAEVDIERGENSGKRMLYTNIVTGRQVLGMWEPGAPIHLKLPLAEVLTGKSNGAVVMVQQEKDGLPGPILGAASFVH